MRRLLGQQGLHQLPQQALVCGLRQVGVERQLPRSHAAHIAVQNGNPLAVAKSRNRRCAGRPYAWQGLQLLRAARKHPAVLRQHLLRAEQQVPRPTVVTQAAPQRQHLVNTGLRQGLQAGKTLHKARVVRQHGGDLGLLQHHLGQPDPVRIALELPRQAAAAAAALPVDQSTGKVRWPCKRRG